MKRWIAILLATALLIACLPLTAAAKELSAEQKFRLLLDDMEIAYAAHRPDSSYYKELAQNDAWVLFRGGMHDPNAGSVTPTYHYATVGNKLIASHIASEPFKSGYGVYAKSSGAFYDLTDAWERGFSGLHDTWNALPSDAELARECSAVLIGDADRDGKVSILDATRIQRILAKLDAELSPTPDSADFFCGWPIAGVSDYDRDGKVSVLDATSIQRKLVSLPKVLDFEIGEVRSSFRYPLNPDPYTSRADYEAVKLITSRAQLEACADAYADRELIAAYTDEFFTTKAVVCICDTTDECGFDVIPEKLSLDPDGTLTAEVLYRVPEGELGLPAAFENHFILLEINRAFIGDVRSAALKTREEWPEDPVIYSAVDLSDCAEMPADPAAEGYRMIDHTELCHLMKMSIASPVFTFEDYDWEDDEVWNGHGYIAVIENSSQLEYVLPRSSSLPSDFPQYDEAFFENQVLIAVCCTQNRDSTIPIILQNIAVKGDTLYAELNADPINKTTPPWISMDECFFSLNICSISRADIEGVKHAALWKSASAHGDNAVVAPITGKTVDAPADLNANGWHRPDAEKITVSAPYHDNMGEYWSEKLPAPELNNCDGYVLLIPDRASLEAYLPGFDAEGQYDDAFFERYAILAMIGQGTEENDTAELDDIAVKGDTLCARAYIKSHYETDEYGEPVLMPSAPVVRTFRRVSKSDVEGVARIDFWRYTYPAVGG